MYICYYDEKTKQFTHTGTAFNNPQKEGDYLIPAFATTEIPIFAETEEDIANGFEPLWNGETWLLSNSLFVATKLIEIDNKLCELDQKSIRAIGEINDASLSPEDKEIAQKKLQEINQEKNNLRAEKTEIITEIKALETEV